MALPADNIVMYFNPNTKSYERQPIPHALPVRIASGGYKWHFSDMDSGSNVYLDESSAAEVEAGYQAWRQYYLRMYDPRGEEGAILEKPPKEVRVRQGWYAGKEYSASFDVVTASRASSNAIQGKHIEVYQQNSTTGFMRTLIRSPQDSVAKPYSGLQVDAKMHSTEGGLKIHIVVEEGQSFFGYRFERTLFLFQFSEEERELAALVANCCEDQELFSLEVARDDDCAGHIFPPPGSGRAVLVIKQAMKKLGVMERHWERHVLSDRDAGLKMEQFGLGAGEAKANDDDDSGSSDMAVEGEPDRRGRSCPHEEKAREEVRSGVAPCKFDLYSYIRNCPCRQGRVRIESCPHRALFDRFNVDEESRREYEEFHLGSLDGEMNGSWLRRREVKGYLMQLCEWRDGDVSHAVVSEDGDSIKLTVVEQATRVCKDAIYNKLVNSAKRRSANVVIVTVRVSRDFADDVGEEGELAAGEGDNDDAVFVTFLAAGGNIFLFEDLEDVHRCFR